MCEFTRFLCRPNATDQPVDPDLGQNFFTEIKSAINSVGFIVVQARSGFGVALPGPQLSYGASALVPKSIPNRNRRP